MTSGSSSDIIASVSVSVPTSSSATATPIARMSAMWASSAPGRCVSARSVISTATVICAQARAYSSRSSSGRKPEVSGSMFRKRMQGAVTPASSAARRALR